MGLADPRAHAPSRRPRSSRPRVHRISRVSHQPGGGGHLHGARAQIERRVRSPSTPRSKEVREGPCTQRCPTHLRDRHRPGSEDVRHLPLSARLSRQCPGGAAVPPRRPGARTRSTSRPSIGWEKLRFPPEEQPGIRAGGLSSEGARERAVKTAIAGCRDATVGVRRRACTYAKRILYAQKGYIAFRKRDNLRYHLGSVYTHVNPT